MINKNDEFKVGIYIRLSKEDLEKSQNSESESIKNQRKLIYKYLKDNALELYKEYIDDGFSGTNFDRPGFNMLINDIEQKKVNMVVTKDLSRLGRDYIKTGYYIEDYFPSKRIRYVSLLDDIDTYQNNTYNDIAPFKALFNDMVSKDTSRKIKSILKNKKEQGLFLGSKAPYGYKKDKTNKNKLIIEPKQSKIVKKIFTLSIAHKSNREIANLLNNANILSPTQSKWTASSVYNILHNIEYTGCLVSNVWTNVSYKNKTRIKRCRSEWIIVENTHEPIIKKEIFEQVQRIKHSKSEYKKITREKLLLEGLIFCKECGSLMGVSFLKKRGYYVLNCNRYKKDSSSCRSHYINYSKLEQHILIRIREIIHATSYCIDDLNIDRTLIFSLIDRIAISKNKEIYIKYHFFYANDLMLNE